METQVKRSPWLVVEGAVLVVLGILALLAPLAAGLAVSLILGVILVLSGVFGLISAMAGAAHQHRVLSLASSVLALAVGMALLFYPLAGPLALALLLAAYLLVDGVILIGLAMDHRRRATARWGWLIASGVIDLILAAALVMLSAVGSTILLGAFVGIDLIVAGAALVFVHRARVEITERPRGADVGLSGYR
ncbi:MAG: DUF308 domain-containing protein [Caulobacteraceae bacterium]|nr:DUF308 domain-containing protein [Caulobacteraceae bacterium]